jgi:hypothetical protein
MQHFQHTKEEIKHLKHVFETLAKTLEMHLKTIANICKSR